MRLHLSVPEQNAPETQHLALLPLDDERAWMRRIHLYYNLYGRDGARWMLEQSPLPTPPEGFKPEKSYCSVSQFVDDKLENVEDGELSASAIYTAYDHWCKNLEVTPETQAHVGRVLQRLGIQKKKYGTIRYMGVRLAA